jgi:hypothetical protein
MTCCDDCKWFEIVGDARVWHCIVEQDMMQESACKRFYPKRPASIFIDTSELKKLF